VGGKKKSGNAGEDGSDQEKVRPTAQTPVAEKAEQYDDARANTKQN
jgi:hypothetical protein